MSNINLWWIPILVLMFVITLLFFTTFYRRFRAFIRYEINWLFIVHIIVIFVSILVFKEHILNFFNTVGVLVFENKKIADITLQLVNSTPQTLSADEIAKLEQINNSIIGNLETTGIAIFALFIPFMFSLYINFYKDTFTGLENIVKPENNSIVGEDIKTKIINTYNSLNARFQSYFLWLKILFFSNILLLLILIFSVFIMYNIEFVIFKYICLNFLKWLNSVVVISFIVLLFSYLFLIIPYYKNLNNSSIFLNKIKK